MKKYLVIIKVKCYEKAKNCWYKTATGRFQCKAKNKIEAINHCLRSYQWDLIYKNEVGYLAEKIEFEEIIDVEVIKEEEKDF